jgi:hypothetical protein
MMKMWLRSVGGWGRVGSMLLSRGSKRASAELIETGILFCLFLGVGVCDRKVDFSFVGPGAGPSCPCLTRCASFCIANFGSLLLLFIFSG